MGKAYRIPGAIDRLRKQQIAIKNLQAENRNRNTPRPEASTAFAGSSGSSNRGGTGNFLSTEGGTIGGPLALGPSFDFTIEMSPGGAIDIGSSNTNNQFTSNIQFEDIQPNTFVLDTISGAAYDGQLLVLRTFAPSIPITIAQATFANGGNIQTLTDDDFAMGNLQTISLIFDESLLIFANTGGTWRVWTQGVSGDGTGDVVGPASSTDNAIARYDGTTGKIIQNSGIIVSDNNDLTNIDRLQISGGTTSVTSVNDVVWYLDADGDLISNINAADSWGWSSGNVIKMLLSDSTLEKRNVTAPVFQLFNTRPAQVGTAGSINFLANSADISIGIPMGFLISDTEAIAVNGRGSLKLGVNLDGTPTLFLTLNEGNNEQVDILKETDFNSNDVLAINRLQISGGTTSATSVNDIVWYVDANSNLVSNTNAVGDWVWSSNNVIKMVLTDSTLEKRNVTAPVFQLFNTRTEQVGTAGTISILANTANTSIGVSMGFITADTEVETTDGSGSLKFGVNLNGTPTNLITINDSNSGDIEFLTNLILGTNFVQFSQITEPAAATVGNSEGNVFFDDTTDPPILMIKKKSSVGAVSVVSLEASGSGVFLPLAGGTMSGDIDMNANALILDADGDSQIQAGTDDVVQISTGGTVQLSLANASTIIAQKTFFLGDIDLNGNELILDADGDTQINSVGDDTIQFITGTGLRANITNTALNMGVPIFLFTNQIRSLGDPTSAQDAATKFYVDSQISGIEDVNLWTDSSPTAVYNFEVFHSNSKNGVDQNTQGNIVQDTIYFVPIFVGEAVTLVEMGIVIKVTAVGTYNLQFGIYSNRTDGSNYPDTLLAEVNAFVSGTGTKTGAFSEVLSAGLYWLAVVSEDRTSTALRYNVDKANVVGYTLDGGVSSFTGILGYTQAHTGSTLPTNPQNDNTSITADVLAVFARFT